MSILTTATRMWLTRSTKPFRFTSDYDQQLPYSDCEQLGLYIHIPFCKKICSFCPYCKVVYTPQLCEEYMDYLIKEIHMVCKSQKTKKKVTSLYFGGGTPALAIHRLKDVMDALEQYFIIEDGIGLELHPDNVTIETLTALKKIGVTKISIGIQSFQDKFLNVLGRQAFNLAKMREALSVVPFETVSMDFIFALPDQNIEDLKADITTAFDSGANHIAIYPFIDFDFTSSDLTPLGKKAKRQLLDDITLYCEGKGYTRDSIWTFSNVASAKYSSMTRDTFLGFGCSATTLLHDQFKVNTFSIDAYKQRIDEQLVPTSLSIRFTPRQRMIYYLFWTAYSTKVDTKDFEKFFGVPLHKKYGLECFVAKMLGFVTHEDGQYTMTLKGAFYYHYYEQFYTLSYIDKMWGIMKKEAFPDTIVF